MPDPHGGHAGADLEALDSASPPSEIVGPSGTIYRGKSLICLSPHVQPRKAAIKFIESKPFEPIILLTILANCFTLAWQSPLDPDGTWKSAFIGICEWLYLGIFTVELLVKIVAYGFVLQEGAYLRIGWCQLDFAVVTLAWLPVIDPSFGNYSAFRSLRALRPLRTLKHVPGMPVLIESIFQAVPRLFTVAGLCSAVLLVFGILGVELFKGSLHHYCTELPVGHPRLDDMHDYSLNVKDLCRPEQASDRCADGRQCLYHASTAMSGTMTFDDMGGALIALLQAVTSDDYDVIMVGLQATVAESSYIYFVLVIIICSFFIINLFLAVMFDEFMKAKNVDAQVESAIESALALASPRASKLAANAPQQAKVAAAEEQAVLLPASSLRSDAEATDAPAAPHNPPVASLTPLVTSDWFSYAAMMLVLVNMALMCMPYQSMTEEYAARLEASQTIVTYIFMLEMTLKLLGLGCRSYWADQWNVLDGTIVILSAAEMVATMLISTGGVKLSFLRMLRMLRVVRVLRLMRSWQGLYRIIVSFLQAMPQLGNMFVLMFLTMVIFSLMGMQLFGGQYVEAIGYTHEICPGNQCADPNLEPLPRFHFDYFGPAMITSFVLLTGKWSEALLPAARVAGPAASLFFGSAVIIGMYLIMNLFVAILLNSFADSFEQQHDDAEDHAKEPSQSVGGGRTMTPARKPATLQSEESRYTSWRDSHLFVPLGSLLRRCCEACAESVIFDRSIILIIIISSVTLAYDSPRLDPTSDLAALLAGADFIFLIIFVLEMLIKVVAFGFVMGDHAYLKNGWNVLDFLIVLATLGAFLSEVIPQLSRLQSLRILRVLRPVRLVSRNPGMKLIVRSLFQSLPDVSNVFGVVLVLQVVFAILGLQLFMGKLGSCSDPTILTLEECVPSVKGKRVAWENPSEMPGSFDDFSSVMLLLYVMSTADGWDAVMYSTMDATAHGRAPVRNDFSGAAIFSIMWMFVGCFFSMNLFVGVIVDNFNRIKKRLEREDEGGTATMTSDQQQWAKTMIATMSNQAIKKKYHASHAPGNWMRRVVHDVVVSPQFETGIFVVITVNILLMACDHWGIENNEEAFKLYQDTTSLLVHIYYVECVLKIIGLGRYYFLDRWCQLDFFLVFAAFIDEFATESLAAVGADTSSTDTLRILRVLRILRIVRLLKGAKQLKKLVLTIMLCMAPLLNVSALLMLTIFIYAVMGVHLFTFVQHQGHLNDETNFDTLGSAALLLFQSLTGDGWSVLMMDAAVTPESGLCSEAAGDCGSSIAVPYFVSFQIIGAFIFLNLVVAVMIESFTELGQEPDHTQEVVTAWQRLTLDPRILAYTTAVRAAGHSDAQLVDLDEIARKRLRDEFDWDVSAALSHLGIKGRDYVPDMRSNPADFSSDIWSIRTSTLRELILHIAPPIGLQGGCASYSDASKICFKLHVCPVNGRVRFRNVVNSLITLKPTASMSSDLELANDDNSRLSKSAPDGSKGSDDSSMVFALQSIKAHVRERRERVHTPGSPANQLTNMRKKKKAKRDLLGVPEHAWDTVTTGVYFPVAPMKQKWDAAIMSFILYSVLMVPYRVGFDDPAVGRMWWFELSITLAFIGDLFATFNTAYLESDRWIISHKSIAARYLQGWFWIDLPASIPIELILLLINASADHSRNASRLKVLRGLRLVRMLRLLKLLKLDEYIASLETTFKINLKVLKVAKMIGLLLFLMHVLGCFWFYIAINSDEEVTWLTEYDDGSALTKAASVKYLYSVYWALMTLTTVGYGDITPTNDTERTYTLFSLLVGALVFGYILSSVGSLISNLDNRSNMIEAKLDQMQEVILHTGIPPSLASRIRSYTEFYYSKQSVYDVEGVLSHLTPALEREVKTYFLSTSVDTMPLLRKYHTAFKLELMAKLKPVMTEAAETVIVKDCRVEDIYFLRKGELHAESSRGRSLFDVSESGRIFGEGLLLGRACTVTYTSFTRCELFTISSTVFAELLHAQLSESERGQLRLKVINELCRKQRMRWLALRLELVSMQNDMKAGARPIMGKSAGVRTCAALCIQAAHIRRTSLTNWYNHMEFAKIKTAAAEKAKRDPPRPLRRRPVSEQPVAAQSYRPTPTLPPALHLSPSVPSSSTERAAEGLDGVDRKIVDFKQHSSTERAAEGLDGVDRKIVDFQQQMLQSDRTLRSAITAQTAKTNQELAALKQQNMALESKMEQIVRSLRYIRGLLETDTAQPQTQQKSAQRVGATMAA